MSIPKQLAKQHLFIGFDRLKQLNDRLIVWIVWKKSEDIYIQYFARPVSSWTHHRLLWCWWFRCMARTTENIRRRQRIRWRARHRLTFYALGIRYTIHTYITFHLIIFEPRSAINLICHLKAADPCVWRCYCTVIIWWLCVLVSLAKGSRGLFFLLSRSLRIGALGIAVERKKLITRSLMMARSRHCRRLGIYCYVGGACAHAIYALLV